mmetsp:Transcript_24193/g.52168  ORF Transcript_24193/g.52168 Transcript_24193/m.52168 type:complete len:415 (-) Transcript_24193:159-1403(-)
MNPVVGDFSSSIEKFWQSKPLRSGDIAVVSGLVGARKYNGSRGIILAESKPDQNGNKRQPVRLFNFNGKVLEVKVGNLKPSQDLTDWALPEYKGTILELLKDPRKQVIADEDNCGMFAEKLWAEMAEKGPAHPLTIDDDLNLRQAITGAEGRKFYWLAMDAIGHHLLVEKCNGSYRMYQASVQVGDFGYSAKQWCFGDMRKKPAWIKWGGGKLLSDKEVNDMLDLVVRWQKLMDVVLKDVLLDAVPGLNQEAIPYLQKGGPSSAADNLGDMVTDAIEHIVKWTDPLFQRIGPEGCTCIGLDPITGRVESGFSVVSVLIGTPANGEHIFTIPAKLYNQCDDLNREMTGEFFSPATFLLMLNSGVWWRARRISGSAVGFSLRAMDMDLRMSEEEGKVRAEEMEQRAIDAAYAAGAR